MAEVLCFVERERRAGKKHYALFLWPSKYHTRSPQIEETSWQQPNSAVSENLHFYSYSLAAPISEDLAKPPNAVSNVFYVEFLNIKFAMQIESLLQNWFLCSSFLWTHSCLHVFIAQASPKLTYYTCTYIKTVLHLFPHPGNHPCCKLKRSKVMKVWRLSFPFTETRLKLKWTYTETRLKLLHCIYV